MICKYISFKIFFSLYKRVGQREMSGGWLLGLIVKRFWAKFCFDCTNGLRKTLQSLCGGFTTGKKIFWDLKAVCRLRMLIITSR